jgi:hypothetical protein
MEEVRNTDSLTFGNLDCSKLSWFNLRTKINNKNDVCVLKIQPKKRRDAACVQEYTLNPLMQVKS